MDQNFLGLGNFAWWFGIVENRLDPLELGRCQVRCFGWHTEDINQIPIEELPWAHPVIPYGMRAVQPPPEGTMVFGFFADGKEGQYPILLGTVPGIPEEIRENNLGFTDPYSDEDKAAQRFPRKIKEAAIKRDSRGIQIKEDVTKRNPSNLNEPTFSRLARPTRGENQGVYDGILPESIANTTIDIQRKTRVPDIITADGGKMWDEPYPSFNAEYPFNHVTETESGHAFEMDDTRGFERVQLSHRTGSTLEFLPEGHTKLKSQKSRYDVTMGDHRSYVNGQKIETVDSDMFLRVNGKLRIECADLEIVSGEKAQIAAGTDVNIRGGRAMNLGALITSLSGLDVNIAASNMAKFYGGLKAVVKSSGVVSMGGALTHVAGSVIEMVTNLFLTAGIQDLNSNIPAVGEVGPTAGFAKSPDMKAGADLKRVSPAASVPKTNIFSKLEQERANQTSVTEATTVGGDKKDLPSSSGVAITAVIDALSNSVKTDIKIPENELDANSNTPISTTSTTTASSQRDPEPDTSGYKGADNPVG